MLFRLKWPNHDHFLLGGVSVDLTLDGVSVPLTITPGHAEGTLPSSTSSPPVAVLTVEFQPTATGTTGSVLRVQQAFELLPPAVSALSPGGPQPRDYVVRPPGVAGDVTQKGRHPLVHSLADTFGVSWTVILRTDVVDATAVQPLLLASLRTLRTAGPKANVRVLARTDGKLPRHYICATPPACSSANATDILCFLTPPQSSPPTSDKPELLKQPAKFAPLGAHVTIFLGTGKHDDTLPVRARDHFSGSPQHPQVVLPRRWEEAVMASGKHVALVLPVPANVSHNSAASGDLPAQLGQVHGALVALGDIAAPNQSFPDPPQLGLAAHSLAGLSLFEAVRLSAKAAFSEIWMFEALEAAMHVDIVARTSARVLYAGWEQSSVEEASAAAARNPALSGRLRRLPDPAPAPKATPAALAASSSLLTHMLEGFVRPASNWNPPRPTMLPNGQKYNQRFEVLHQLVVQGNDADGDLFLTKALTSSVFR